VQLFVNHYFSLLSITHSLLLALLLQVGMELLTKDGVDWTCSMNTWDAVAAAAGCAAPENRETPDRPVLPAIPRRLNPVYRLGAHPKSGIPFYCW
jgi:hypothetical protein